MLATSTLADRGYGNWCVLYNNSPICVARMTGLPLPLFRKSDPGNNLILGLESGPKSKREIQIHFNESYIGNFIEKKGSLEGESPQGFLRS